MNAIAPKKVAKKRGPAGGTKYTSRAEEQIEYLRGANAPDYLIPRTAFIRLVKETLDQLAAANLAFADGGGVRMGSDALACVQWACEGMLSELFADVAAAAAHGKRIGIMPKDLKLALGLRRLEHLQPKPRDEPGAKRPRRAEGSG